MELNLAGRTALVTGAPRGSGARHAAALAQEGVKVWLHGFDTTATEAACDGIPVPGPGQCPRLRRCRGRAGRGPGGQPPGYSGEQLWARFPGGPLRKRLGWKCTRSTFFPPRASAARCCPSCAPPKLDALSTWGPSDPLNPLRKTSLLRCEGRPRDPDRFHGPGLAGTGVRVNLVAPGIIRTDEVVEMLTAWAAKAGLATDWSSVEAHATRHWYPNLLGRLAEREEVADLVTFLASDRAAFLHGQLLRIDGGAVPIVS